jgi:hypothetical protein
MPRKEQITLATRVLKVDILLVRGYVLAARMSIGRSEQLATSAAHRKKKLMAELLKLEMPLLSLSMPPSLGPLVVPKVNILQDRGYVPVARMLIGRNGQFARSVARQENKPMAELPNFPQAKMEWVPLMNILQDHGYAPVAKMLIGQSDQLAINVVRPKGSMANLPLLVTHLAHGNADAGT